MGSLATLQAGTPASPLCCCVSRAPLPELELVRPGLPSLTVQSPEPGPAGVGRLYLANPRRIPQITNSYQVPQVLRSFCPK